jgi:predicted ATPase
LLGTLADYFQGKPSLLVLDNCEQVVASAPQIADLLETTRLLKVLVTSRIVLKVRGEQEYHLHPLPTPAAELQRLAELLQVPAVKLFTDRANDIRSDFQLTESSAPAVAEICRRLDGLPLAIELAAARVRLLTPQDLLSRLGRCLDELSGGSVDAPERQRALRATIEWSFDLLAQDEQILFARLAVFLGGWSLEAAEDVCRDPSFNTLDVLSSLAEKSLIAIDHPSGSVRFRMLETVRAFALEKLAASDELTEMQGRHASYFLEFAQYARGQIEGVNQAEWLRRTEFDNENLRLAVAWFLENHDVESLARLAYALRRYWRFHDQVAENRAWMERIFPETEWIDPDVRARFLLALAFAEFESGNLPQWEPVLREANSRFVETGFQPGLVWSFCLLGLLTLISGGTPREALWFTGQAESIGRRTDDLWLRFYAITVHANVLGAAGDLADGVALHREALELARQLGIPHLLAHAYIELAFLELQVSEAEAAAQHLDEAAHLLRHIHSREGLSYLLDGRGIQAVINGDPLRAATAFAAADAIRDAIHIETWPQVGVMRQRFLDSATAALSSDELQAASEAGKRMSTDEAMRFAAPAGETVS